MGTTVIELIRNLAFHLEYLGIHHLQLGWLGEDGYWPVIPAPFF